MLLACVTIIIDGDLVGHVSLQKGETIYCRLNTYINYNKTSIDYGMRHKVGRGVC